MPDIFSPTKALNVTEVNGASWTGLQASDGSINVVEVDNTTWTGLYNNCGAMNVFVVDGSTFVGLFANCGAMNVYVGSTTNSGAMPVVDLIGTLGGSISDGILLEDGTSFVLMENGTDVVIIE